MSKAARLDKVYPPPIGRIQKSFGTTDPATIAGIKQMVAEYAGNPNKHETLMHIRDGKVTLLNAHANRATGAKIILNDDVAFDPLVFEWVEQFAKEGRAESTLERYRECFNALVIQWKDGKKGLSYVRPPDYSPKNRGAFERINFPLTQLPVQLKAYRVVCVDRGTAEQFNKTRNSCRSFLNNHFNEEHELYRAVKLIKPIVASGFKTRTNPASVLAVVDMCEKLNLAYAAQFWSMCLTGSGFTEYAKVPTLDGHGIHVAGEKMKRIDDRRNRMVPNVQNCSPFRDGRIVPHPAPIAIQKQKFLDNLKKHSDGKIKIETARKCFATWCKHAHIDLDRIQQYMGHAPQTMTERYSRERVQKWLEEDAKLLRDYIEKQKGMEVNPLADEFFTFENAQPSTSK